ncbi:MAG: thioredoxin family protein [Lachnospirales bacterium]
MLQSINNDDFESEVLNSNVPVLLEFYSDSCIPCKRMSPILAELEEEHTDIKVSKLNIKFGADTARKYNVMSSPTIVFFKNGEEVNRIKGVAKKADLEAVIKEIV